MGNNIHIPKVGTVQFSVWAHCGEDGWCQISQDYNRRKKAQGECSAVFKRRLTGKCRMYYSNPKVVRHVVTADDVAEMTAEAASFAN